MREIKFKVFCKRHNREEIYTLGDLIVCNAGSENGEGGIFKNWRQYTGLKDKNGEEIYEGDIIHIPDDWEEYGWASGENYSIDFKDGRFRLRPKYKPNAIGYDLENTEKLEVIGNVWEDSDLLNDSKNTKTNKV